MTGHFERRIAYGKDDDSSSVYDDLDDAPNPQSVVCDERARSIIRRSHSLGIAFLQSVNRYRGREQGCVYRFARLSHAYVESSPGLDFETSLFAKANAGELPRAGISKPG